MEKQYTLEHTPGGETLFDHDRHRNARLRRRSGPGIAILNDFTWEQRLFPQTTLDKPWCGFMLHD
eukprot:4166319-Amphidinium_carterae.2